MRTGLPEHFAVVGPAWLDFERAVRGAGGVGEDLNAQLDSLRARCSDATIDEAHQLRRQRNALFHDGTLIRDLRGWEESCRRTMAGIRSPAGTGARRRRPRQAGARRGGLAGIAVLVAVAAAGLLGIVLVAWNDAESCIGLDETMSCILRTEEGFLLPAAGILALAVLLAGLVLSRRARR